MIQNTERWVGMSVVSTEVQVVDFEVSGDRSTLRVVHQETWKLQNGDRPQAYRVMYEQVVNYLRENNTNVVVVKGSQASQNSMKQAHLEAAELRGVIQAAAAQIVDVKVRQKSYISRTVGSRKVDQYIKDDSFWSEKFDGALLRKSREPAFLVYAVIELEK